MKKICLGLIVKNENGTMRRTLESIKQCIDSWVIIDTGSTDGTQETIQECLKEIPGMLLERPIATLSQLRELAQSSADYFFTLDPFERLLFREKFSEMEVSRLKNQVEKEPKNANAAYLLAQCYTYMNQKELALKAYEKRAAMAGGDTEETYHSLYMVGILSDLLELQTEKVISSYCKAHRARPSRAEPLYRLGEFYRRKGNYFLSYLVSRFALTIPVPPDKLALEKNIYEIGLLNQFSDSCLHIGKKQELVDFCKKRTASGGQQMLLEKITASLEEQPTVIGRRSM